MCSPGGSRVSVLKRIDRRADTGGVNENADTTAHSHSDRIARAAWFCTFVVPLALAGLLLGVKSAQAASPAPGTAPIAFEEDLSEEFGPEEEAEFFEEECEIAEEEAAEGEISAAEAKEICIEAEEAAKEVDGSHEGANAECPIHSASAHASIQHEKLKLTVGYTTTTPVTATILIGGPVKASFKRHLGKSGVLRFTKRLRGKTHGHSVVHIELPAPERAACPSRLLLLLAR